MPGDKPYFPQRRFMGEQGHKSIDQMGPEAISADIDAVNAMFDPAAVHSDGARGGIDEGNLRFGFGDAGFSGKVASDEIPGLEYEAEGKAPAPARTVWEQIAALFQGLARHKGDFGNPHGVTKEQVGLGWVGGAIEAVVNGLGTAAGRDVGTGPGDLPEVGGDGRLDGALIPGPNASEVGMEGYGKAAAAAPVNPQDSAMSAIGKLEKANDGFAGQLAEAMEAAGGVAALAAGLESLKEEIAGLWLAISSGGAAPFVETFAQLEGELEAGVWNEGMARLEC